MRTSSFLLSVFVIGLSGFSGDAAAQNKIQLEGLSGELRENVSIYLQKYPPEDISTSLRFQARIEQDIQSALQAVGYYNSSVDFELKSGRSSSTIIAKVQAGQPVIIERTDIQLSGEAAEDPDFITLIRNQAPKKGAVLHHGHYEALKSALRSLALRKGYFDADFTLSRLEVAPELQQAFIRLHFRSGYRYKFGKVSFSGNQISESRLQSLVPFAENDHYLATELGEFNQSLANTNWFSSILIESDNDQIENYIIPINVTLQPQRKNSIETGIGYSDDVGPRLKLNWNKPWLNSAGHSLSTKLAVSGVEQSIEAAYKLPLPTVATDFYQVQLGVRNRDNQDTRSQEVNLALERHWLLRNQWYRTASIRWLYEDFTQADQSDTISLIMPGLSYSRSRQRGGTMPRFADRLLLGIEVSDQAWGSDASFVRLRGRAGWIGSAGNNHRFVTRLDAGAILMEAVEQLPPSLRFFAGGENNLRGYAYESVSPRNENNELIGGRYMLTSTLEYQYRMTGNWWLASFADYGSAWTDTPDWKRGVGFGVRWASPVGPIRLDLAWGLDDGERNAFRIHFALGPEL
ncbi:autotransporter assembly complex family protein [Chromatiaceae bacterium AAb-1]|nr:autotransporter assembly complex family protein [Chromatiaceae bacterium AAb-1]